MFKSVLGKPTILVVDANLEKYNIELACGVRELDACQQFSRRPPRCGDDLRYFKRDAVCSQPIHELYGPPLQIRTRIRRSCMSRLERVRYRFEDAAIEGSSISQGICWDSICFGWSGGECVL